jgi:hypothetical protein
MQVFGIKLWDKSQKDFLVEIERGLKASKKFWIATVNPEFIVECWRDKKFFKILTEKTSYNVIDGNGLLWAAKLGRKSLITGVELMEELLVQWLLLDQSQEFMTVQKVLWELQSVPPLELLLLVLGYSYVEYQCPSFFP